MNSAKYIKQGHSRKDLARVSEKGTEEAHRTEL